MIYYIIPLLSIMAGLSFNFLGCITETINYIISGYWYLITAGIIFLSNSIPGSLTVMLSMGCGSLGDYYGYQWWIIEERRILALGYKGQYLIIDPEAMMVTVFTARLEEKDFILPYDLYREFIALLSDGAVSD